MHNPRIGGAVIDTRIFQKNIYIYIYADETEVFYNLLPYKTFEVNSGNFHGRKLSKCD